MGLQGWWGSGLYSAGRPKLYKLHKPTPKPRLNIGKVPVPSLVSRSGRPDLENLDGTGTIKIFHLPNSFRQIMRKNVGYLLENLDGTGTITIFQVRTTSSPGNEQWYRHLAGV